MPFVSSQNRDIYYERHGAGPAILFLHGAGSNAATWWQQLPAFAPEYTCLTMDIRCFGRSAAPPDEFSLALFVADGVKFFNSTAFRFKFASIVIGIVLAVIIKNSVLNDAPRLDAERGTAPAKAKALAVVSILMWISAIGFGRYMAYE